jgi:UDP-N-acetylmuramoyl-tripeptide--D-alanyl-D-alanine ligase
MIDLREAAAAAGGHLEGEGVAFGVTIDSREVRPGDLFVALPGERVDGHSFVGRAFAAGAAGVLVRRDAPVDVPPGRAAIRVDDPLAALARIAAWWRGRFVLPLVAVTGSNGKTTVKEMVASILRAAAGSPAAVLATEGNLNNQIGLPLTLLRLRPGHRYAVCELGTSSPGEIAALTRLARPGVAAVNNAAAAHLEGLGSVENVARAKGEIFAGLAPDGVAVINADDAFAPYWRSLAAGRRVIEFGLDAPAQVGASLREAGGRTVVELSVLGERVDTELQVAGRHNVANALCAAACAAGAGVAAGPIAAGLHAFAGVEGRLRRRAARRGATVIDDTYNANPASTRAAIDVLCALPGRRILALADMRELGPEAPRLHREIGAYARERGVGALYATGEATAEAVAGFGAGARHFATAEALAEALEPESVPGTVVLVKGSRSMRMERVVAALTGGGAG